MRIAFFTGQTLRQKLNLTGMHTETIEGVCVGELRQVVSEIK